MSAIRHLLCPIDLSEISRHALDHALAIAEWYESRVTVLHVCAPPPLVPPSAEIAEDVGALPPTPNPDDVIEDVRRFSGLDRPSGYSRAEVLVVEGSPVKEILKQAKRLSADLLVMGTHGRSGFEALFLGSVTEKVLRSIDVPVLTVPPPVEHVKNRCCTRRSSVPLNSLTHQ